MKIKDVPYAIVRQYGEWNERFGCDLSQRAKTTYVKDVTQNLCSYLRID